LRTAVISIACLPFAIALGSAPGCSSNSSGETPEAGSEAGVDGSGGADVGSEATVSEGGPDGAVACPGGKFTWATAGGGAGQGNQVNGVAIDSSGNAWVVGTFIGSAKWGTFNLTAADTVHASTFFAKLDPNGKVLLARAIPSSIANVASPGGRIRVDAQGNAYIVATFAGSITLDGVTVVQDDTMGGGAAFVLKVNPMGKAIWGIGSANQGGSDESGNDVAIDSTTGDVYLVGSYNGYAVFFNPGMPDDGGTTPAVTTTPATGGEEKAYIAKFSQTSMTWQWAQGWIGGGNDGGISRAVVLNPSNSTVTVFGDINTELTIGNTNLTGDGGSFVATLAQNDGHVVWVSQMAPAGTGNVAHVHGAVLDSTGNLYAAGELSGPTTFLPASAFAVDGGSVADAGAGLTVTPSGNDAFLVKYDASGTPSWAKHGGMATSATRADDVAYDGQTGIYISGFTQGATFDTIPFAHTENLFVARYDTSGTIQWLTGSDDVPDAGPGVGQGEGNALAVTSPTGGVVVGGGFGSDPTALGTLVVDPIGTDTGLVTRLCN
jgi:hypothetical protein